MDAARSERRWRGVASGALGAVALLAMVSTVWSLREFAGLHTREQWEAATDASWVYVAAGLVLVPMAAYAVDVWISRACEARGGRRAGGHRRWTPDRREPWSSTLAIPRVTWVTAPVVAVGATTTIALWARTTAADQPVFADIEWRVRLGFLTASATAVVVSVSSIHLATTLFEPAAWRIGPPDRRGPCSLRAPRRGPDSATLHRLSDATAAAFGLAAVASILTLVVGVSAGARAGLAALGIGVFLLLVALSLRAIWKHVLSEELVARAGGRREVFLVGMMRRNGANDAVRLGVLSGLALVAKITGPLVVLASGSDFTSSGRSDPWRATTGSVLFAAGTVLSARQIRRVTELHVRSTGRPDPPGWRTHLADARGHARHLVRTALDR